MKNLAFVDEDWVTANSTATSSTEGENTVYTLDGTSYYYIGAESETKTTLEGTPKSPQMISVSAYDANGKVLCATSVIK